MRLSRHAGAGRLVLSAAPLPAANLATVKCTFFSASGLLCLLSLRCFTHFPALLPRAGPTTCWLWRCCGRLRRRCEAGSAVLPCACWPPARSLPILSCFGALAPRLPIRQPSNCSVCCFAGRLLYGRRSGDGLSHPQHAVSQRASSARKAPLTLLQSTNNPSHCVSSPLAAASCLLPW